jgi:hypothetical protein
MTVRADRLRLLRQDRRQLADLAKTGAAALRPAPAAAAGTRRQPLMQLRVLAHPASGPSHGGGQAAQPVADVDGISPGWVALPGIAGRRRRTAQKRCAGERPWPRPACRITSARSGCGPNPAAGAQGVRNDTTVNNGGRKQAAPPAKTIKTVGSSRIDQRDFSARSPNSADAALDHDF